mgnify:CR=1 FL=1
MKQQKERDRFSTQSSIKWFLDVGYHLGTLTETHARRLVGVNRTTFDRWLRGESSAPPAALELLRLHAFGEPPGGFGSRAWDGFRFQNGFLSTPYGDLTPGDLQSFHFYRLTALQYIAQARINNNERQSNHAIR